MPKLNVVELAVILAILGCAPGGGAPGMVTDQGAGASGAPQESAAEQAASLRVRVLTSGDPAPRRPTMSTLPPTRQPLCPGAVSWQEARQHVGRNVTVEGPVVEVRRRGPGTGGKTLLAIGQPYADPNRFTIRLEAEFPYPPAASGQRIICATGHIESVGATLVMDVEDPSAIVLLEGGEQEDPRR